ncbi:hypothetical protein RHGRI_025414 [Rhododendron griersonianum]|uniref:DUF4220 domain-containing protein n=1 Tax=Rhododendron griersonianum TaxID=479676 RepID=A0AAV6IP66_9ERIC|nr:hypothetical protein RHGRI_025414 [Rhododendron griersonianum]
MFAVGVIKYGERTRALYLASSKKFKESLLTEPDPGPNYAKLMAELASNTGEGLQKKREWNPEPSRVNRKVNNEDWDGSSDLKVVQVAYKYFDTFKGLIADVIFSFCERDQSRDFFLKRTSTDAFKVVEVELNFFYEILYTKATVLHDMFGYSLRILSFSLNCVAAGLFYSMEKKEFQKFDIGISYTLLFGAIALDLIAGIMVLHSDWIVVALTKSDHPSWFTKTLSRVLIDWVRWPKNPGKKRCFSFGKIMNIVRLRWCESLSKYNLINYCLHPRSKWLKATIGIFGLNNLLDGMKYVKTENFTIDLRDLIFEELKKKSKQADDLETTKEIFSARGDWILRSERCTDLLRWISEVEFDESLILWHIATDLCYYTDEVNTNANDGGNPTNLGSTNSDNEDNKDYKESSKLLSDYLLYLLIMQSTMLSTVAGIGQIRFRDTSAEAQKFFRGSIMTKSKGWNICCLNFGKCFYGNESEVGQSQSQTSCFCNKCCSKGEKGRDRLQEQACESILAVKTLVEPSAIKGDKSKSLLFDACMLANELKKLERQRMWQIISKVWVELLCYAASHCRANDHVAQLSKGGQLLTLVWLLMAHLGIGDRFQISEGHARAKLIMRK